MKTEQLIKKISAIPAGRFFRVRYISKVKIKAAFEKEGYSIFKVVDTTTRTGVKYSSVVKNDNKTPSEKQNNWTWVVKNRIKHNTNTGKDYLVVAPIGKGNNSKVTYMCTTPEGTTCSIPIPTVKEFTVDSYWKETKPSIVTISLDNILMVK